VTAGSGLGSWEGQLLTENNHFKWTFNEAESFSEGIIINCSIENLSDTKYWIYIPSARINGRYADVELDNDDINPKSKVTLAMTIYSSSNVDIKSLVDIHTLELEIDVSEPNEPYDTIKLYSASFTANAEV
jgi:hypothetical protein